MNRHIQDFCDTLIMKSLSENTLESIRETYIILKDDNEYPLAYRIPSSSFWCRFEGQNTPSGTQSIRIDIINEKENNHIVDSDGDHIQSFISIEEGSEEAKLLLETMEVVLL